MTITREQVADLQPGDVVEYSGHRDLHGAKIVGPLHVGPTGSLCVGDYVVRSQTGAPGWSKSTVTVVSRAPRPLYVNHPRTEPVRGDVARDAESDNGARCWVYGGVTWHWTEYPTEVAGGLERVRLRLLVDGETGQVVP